MAEFDPQIDELEKRLDDLVRTQIDFQKEISLMRGQIRKLRAANETTRAEKRSTASYYAPPQSPETPPSQPSKPATEQPKYSEAQPYEPPARSASYQQTAYQSATPTESAFSRRVNEYTENARADLEKFIGENLLSKIGIVVLIIGVGIGVKYSIDNNLISPLTRIILGYIFGFGLVGLGVKLKPKYHNFSAVLVSGGMAIMYFVTYFGYSLYGLIGQGSGFGLMAMFTVFTVAAAVVYNRQVIAHIGLVGAYAVPFLLSSDSGNYRALFIYIAIINTGILAISVWRYWKPLFFTSFAFTWLIFYAWFLTKYSVEHFYLALTFLAAFFAIFFATKIIHVVFHDERDDIEAKASAAVTGFVFYAFCLAVSNAELSLFQFTTLFTYIAAMTAILLLLSFRFFGKPIVYVAFAFVWIIYAAWFTNRYEPEMQSATAAVFAAIFFAIFYALSIAYRLIDERFGMIEHAGLVLTNSFVFYGFGYAIVDGQQYATNFLGLYTAGHAAMHFAVAALVNKMRSLADDVIQVLTILILTFASIAIPVQFDGNAVTMIWAVEAALLFWFGRARGVRLFEYFSYPVMVLATGSLFLDWAASYMNRTLFPSEFNLRPLANGDFITAAVFVTALAFIYLTNRDEKFEAAIDKDFVKPIGYALAVIGVFVFYNMFRIEIGNYFHMHAAELRAASGDPRVTANGVADLGRFNVVWQLNYTMFFLAAMAAVNLRRIRSSALALANVAIALLTFLVVATVGMFLFYELRVSYVGNSVEHELLIGSMNATIRYITYAFAGALLYMLYEYSRDDLMTKWMSHDVLKYGFEAVVYSFCFIAASCELVNLMGQFYIPDATKLGLSILWGVYALMLIVIGIARNKKHLRIAAMALLGVTLAKLFFYDIADLDTIPKTILFVSLGITLLVISFLYNKYKNMLFGVSTKRESESTRRSVTDL